MNTDKGFTLLEIVAVLLVIGILAGVALPNYFDLTRSTGGMTAAAARDEVQSRIQAKFAEQLKLGRPCSEALETAVSFRELADADGTFRGYIVAESAGRSSGSLNVSIKQGESGTSYTETLALPVCPKGEYQGTLGDREVEGGGSQGISQELTEENQQKLTQVADAINKIIRDPDAVIKGMPLKRYLQDNYFAQKKVFESADADPDVVSYIETRLNEMLGYASDNQYTGRIWAIYVNNNGNGNADQKKLFTVYATNVSRSAETADDYLRQTIRNLVGTVRFQGAGAALTGSQTPWDAFYIQLTSAQTGGKSILHIAPSARTEPAKVVPTGPEQIYIDPPLPESGAGTGV